jgi:hypothetical protein
MGQIEKDIFELWKELSPSDAFAAGLQDYAGKLTVPERAHMEALARRIDELGTKTETRAQQRLLASLKAYGIQLGSLGEAEITPDLAISAFFAHLIKEGVVPIHLTSLAEHVGRALTAYAASSPDKLCPTGIRILTSIRCAGLVEVADTVKKQTKNDRLQSALNGMLAAVNDYSKRFGVAGFKNSGFDEIVEICSREGCDLGRRDYYADALANLFDYSETPTELEAKGLNMLNRELADFKREVEELAPKLGAEATAEAVAHTISKKKALKPARVVGYIKILKQHVSKLVNSKIVKINSRYQTRVVETPTYLSGMFPSGGARSLNFLAKRPFQVFLATTDPRRAPETSPAELLNLLVHEEYGIVYIHPTPPSNSVPNRPSQRCFSPRLETRSPKAYHFIENWNS